MNGIELIAAERKEQVEKHKRTIKQDKELNKDFQLSKAAGILIENMDVLWGYDRSMITWFTPKGWDHNIWNKMCHKSYKERLIIAGALIAAEIDRISE